MARGRRAARTGLGLGGPPCARPPAGASAASRGGAPAPPSPVAATAGAKAAAEATRAAVEAFRADKAAKAADEAFANMNKQIDCLTNRLDRALKSFNCAVKDNQELRYKIDNLRRERQVYDAIHQKLCLELTHKQKETLSLCIHFYFVFLCLSHTFYLFPSPFLFLSKKYTNLSCILSFTYMLSV